MNLRALFRQPVLSVSFQQSEALWAIGGRGRITASGRVPLPPGLVNDGVVTDPERAGLLLREAPDFTGNARMQAVAGLPAQRTVVRTLKLPPLQGRPFAEMVEREIRRELPVVAENAYVSWTPGTRHADSIDVLAIGLARDVLDSHVAALRAAGLAPVAADLRLIASARALGLPDCILASVEAAEVELGIFRGGVPVILRHVALAASPGDSAWIDQIQEELLRTNKFYFDSHRDDSAFNELPISFTGGAASRVILSGKLGAATGHEIQMPPAVLTLHPEEEGPRFAANIGLTLKDMAA
ncbi:MAG: pilus assembly protein PilM [Dehalococcoidia bacterium]